MWCKIDCFVIFHLCISGFFVQISCRLWYKVFRYMFCLPTAIKVKPNDCSARPIVRRMDYNHCFILLLLLVSKTRTKEESIKIMSVEFFNRHIQRVPKCMHAQQCHNARHLKLEPAYYSSTNHPFVGTLLLLHFPKKFFQRVLLVVVPEFQNSFAEK